MNPMKISYPVASFIGSIAENEALSIGVPMAIAITDAEGGLILFSRMDGALPASTDIAISKAYTAAALRMSTQELGELAQPGKPLYGIQQTLPGKIVLFGGGLPLRFKEKIIGAIGLSGGSVDEDIKVAEAASDSLKKMELWQKALLPLMPPKPEGNNWGFRLKNRLMEVLAGLERGDTAQLSAILAGAILLSYADD
jgi:uncharacterized protein GlcG (DUF336 family)